MKIQRTLPILIIYLAFIVAIISESTTEPGEEEGSESSDEDDEDTTTSQTQMSETTTLNPLESMKNETWIRALRYVFMKWGYSENEIPEPFGTLKEGDANIQLTPEFSVVLKSLKDSIPVDLKGAIDKIVKQEGIDVESSQNASGNSTAIKEIQKTIQDILNGENSNSDPPTTTSKSDSDNNNGSDTSSTTNHGSYTTFCDEMEGPCKDQDNNDVPMNMSRDDLFKLDEKSLEKLLKELKLFLENNSSLGLNGLDKANYDLVKINRLVHEIESIAEKLAAAQKQKGSGQKRPHNGHHKHHKSTTRKLSKEELAEAKDKLILNKMEENNDNPPDVTIIGNSMKEVQHHLGKIAFEAHTKDSGVETVNLSSLIKTQEEKAHNKHKETLLELIRTLKFTGESEEDKKRIKKIEELIEAIDKEHHKHPNNAETGQNSRKRGDRRYRNRKQQQRLKLIQDNLLGMEESGEDLEIKKEKRIHIKRIDPTTEQALLLEAYQLQPVNNFPGPIATQVTQGRPIPMVPQFQNNNVNVANKLLMDPSEVNLNGGFIERINVLKENYPTGRWPIVAPRANKGWDWNHAQAQQQLIMPPMQNFNYNPANIVNNGNPHIPIHFIDEENYDNEGEQENNLNYGNGNSDKSNFQNSNMKVFTDLEPQRLEEIIKIQQGNGQNRFEPRDHRHHVQEHEAQSKLSAKMNYIL